MSQNKPTLILVDDEPDMTEILEAYLEDDFECICFNDSMDALEHLQSNQYTLMITDIRMPRLDGMELTSKAKAIDPTMAIIQCTGHAISESDIEDGMKKGAVAVLKKPFGSPEHVMEFITSNVPYLFPESGEKGPVESEVKPTGEPTSNATQIATTLVDDLKKVLIVDDDIDVAEVLEALIESEFNVKVETDELHALDLIKQNNYDIVITDLNMPQMSGQDLVKEIISTKPNATIIISSGHQEDSPEVKAALQSGARGLIAKPFGDPDSLISTLRKLSAA